MNISRIFLSALMGATCLLIAFLFLDTLGDMAFNPDGTPVTGNPNHFTIAEWVWALLTGATGVLLGLMRTTRGSAVELRRYLAAIELAFWCWFLFFLAHVAALFLTILPGGHALTLAAFAVSISLLMLWQLNRPAIRLGEASDHEMPARWTA